MHIKNVIKQLNHIHNNNKKKLRLYNKTVSSKDSTNKQKIYSIIKNKSKPKRNEFVPLKNTQRKCYKWRD